MTYRPRPFLHGPLGTFFINTFPIVHKIILRDTVTGSETGTETTLNSDVSYTEGKSKHLVVEFVGVLALHPSSALMFCS